MISTFLVCPGDLSRFVRYIGRGETSQPEGSRLPTARILREPLLKIAPTSLRGHSAPYGSHIGSSNPLNPDLEVYIVLSACAPLLDYKCPYRREFSSSEIL